MRRTVFTAACVAVLALPAGAGAVNSAPTATTGPATAITASSATLTGTLNPNGQATSYHFEYGTSTAYGQATPVASANGSSAIAVSAGVTGLQPGIVYHYRLVATNPTGTSMGADVAFTTAPAAATVLTGQPSAVTASSATAMGSVNPNGQATAYSFQYGTSTAYGQVTPTVAAGSGTTPVAVSAHVTGLLPGTLYHYRITATNASGISTGADVSFTTATAAPTVITGLPTHTYRHGGTLTGSVNPGGALTTYFFQVGPTTNYGLRTDPRILAAGTTAQSVSATLGALQSNRQFHYRLVAVNAATTSYGADRTFTTGPSRLAPLAVVARTTPTVATFYPYRFFTFGRIVVPRGVSRSRACHGFVAVRFKSGSQTISLRRAYLNPQCGFSSRVTFRIPRRIRRGRLGVTVLFSGNGVLLPQGARGVEVFVG